MKELYDGSNSNTAHGNRGTEHRHRQPRDEVCRPHTGNCNPRHQVGTSGVLNNSSGYHRIAPCTRSYSEVLKPPAPYTRPTVSTDVHPDPVVGAGETPTDDQSAIENTNAIHITRKDIACLTDGEHTKWNAKAIQRYIKTTAGHPDTAGYATATTTADNTSAATLADDFLAATAADDTTAAIAANDATAANGTAAADVTTVVTAADDTTAADVTTPATATNDTAADDTTAAIAVNGIIVADDTIDTTVAHDPAVITAADEPTATTATVDATIAAAVDGIAAARNTSAVNDSTAANDSDDPLTSSDKADNRSTENVNNDVRNSPALVNTGDSLEEAAVAAFLQ